MSYVIYRQADPDKGIEVEVGPNRRLGSERRVRETKYRLATHSDGGTWQIIERRSGRPRRRGVVTHVSEANPVGDDAAMTDNEALERAAQILEAANEPGNAQRCRRHKTEGWAEGDRVVVHYDATVMKPLSVGKWVEVQADGGLYFSVQVEHLRRP